MREKCEGNVIILKYSEKLIFGGTCKREIWKCDLFNENKKRDNKYWYAWWIKRKEKWKRQVLPEKDRGIYMRELTAEKYG